MKTISESWNNELPNFRLNHNLLVIKAKNNHQTIKSMNITVRSNSLNQIKINHLHCTEALICTSVEMYASHAVGNTLQNGPLMLASIAA